MRDQAITTRSGSLIVACDEARNTATIQAPRATIELAPGEVLMTIEALAMAYATLCGSRPDSAARGVNRTLRNRTRARVLRPDPEEMSS